VTDSRASRPGRPAGRVDPNRGCWIRILEVTSLLLLAQPFTENFGKRSLECLLLQDHLPQPFLPLRD